MGRMAIHTLKYWVNRRSNHTVSTLVALPGAWAPTMFLQPLEHRMVR